MNDLYIENYKILMKEIKADKNKHHIQSGKLEGILVILTKHLKWLHYDHYKVIKRTGK